MSRTAIQARPMELRTMFFAANASRATSDTTSRYFISGVSKEIPRISIFCAVMTPELE